MYRINISLFLMEQLDIIFVSYHLITVRCRTLNISVLLDVILNNEATNVIVSEIDDLSTIATDTGV